jgi:hypothetical protein
MSTGLIYNCLVFFSWEITLFAMAYAKRTGTAFPICWYWLNPFSQDILVLIPSKIKSSGNDCSLAPLRAERGLGGGSWTGRMPRWPGQAEFDDMLERHVPGSSCFMLVEKIYQIC